MAAEERKQETHMVPVRFVRGDDKVGEQWECCFCEDPGQLRRNSFKPDEIAEGCDIKSIPCGGSIDCSVSISDSGDVIQSVEAQGAMMSEHKCFTGDEGEVWFRLTHDGESKEVVVTYVDRKD